MNKFLGLAKSMEEFATNSKIYSKPRNLPRVQWEFFLTTKEPFPCLLCILLHNNDFG